MIEPDFIKLEIQITLDLEAGEAGETRTLTRDDVEGDSYDLPPIPSSPSSPRPAKVVVVRTKVVEETQYCLTVITRSRLITLAVIMGHPLLGWQMITETSMTAWELF